MEIPPLTEWEKRERDGLLALETPEWREKRLVAEDPNTTGEMLQVLAKEIIVTNFRRRASLWEKGGRQVYEQERNGALLVEALAQHPNMPPDTLRDIAHTIYTPSDNYPLYNSPYPVYAPSARGICRNSITPLIELETPAFWQNLTEDAAFALLREDTLPKPAAISLTHHPRDWHVGISVAVEAKTHIAVAGKLETQAEGQAALTEFWQGYCLNTTDKREQEQHDEMAQLGMAPAWAMGARANTLRGAARWYRRIDILRETVLWYKRLPLFSLLGGFMHSLDPFATSAFVKFVFLPQKTSQTHANLLNRGLSLDWTRRFAAALRLPLTDSPFPNDPLSRSPRLLLEHLARDGNRFVRWAAQTRLADPNFTFTWQDDE